MVIRFPWKFARHNDKGGKRYKIIDRRAPSKVGNETDREEQYHELELTAEHINNAR